MPARALASHRPGSIQFPRRRETCASGNRRRCARRRRLHILLANRSRRIHRHHVHPAAPGLQRDLLGHELRPLVMADHVGQRNRRILVRRMSVRVNPMVATLEVYTTRRTPFFRAASRIARVPPRSTDTSPPDRAPTAGSRRPRETRYRSRTWLFRASRHRADRRSRSQP